MGAASLGTEAPVGLESLPAPWRCESVGNVCDVEMNGENTYMLFEMNSENTYMMARARNVASITATIPIYRECETYDDVLSEN